jgi:type VI secretion system secreted protein Hcp
VNWIINTRNVWCAAGVAWVSALGLTQAAPGAFLKLEGVKGEVAEASHPEWIRVHSLQWGVLAGGATNAPRLTGLQLVKPLDKASPLLYRACATGKHFPQATLDLVREMPRRVRYYRITLEDVIVSGCQSNGSAEESPMEQVGMVFGRMSWTYHEYARDGVPLGEVAAFWDVLANTGGLETKPAMRVSGTPASAGGEVTLAFPGVSGVTYRVLGAPDPAGPYLEVSRVTAEVTGPLSLSAPVSGPGRFFQVEEVP